jgi:hypothetical protein
MRAKDRKILPESRLYGAMWGAGMLLIGLFIYSFTQYGYLPRIAPTIPFAPIAIGFTSGYYGENSSSAIAGQGLIRNILGGVAPLFASQFFHNVGSRYAGLIRAIFGTLLTFILFVMFKCGHILRERSQLAKNQLGGDEQKEKAGLHTAPFVWKIWGRWTWYCILMWTRYIDSGE